MNFSIPLSGIESASSAFDAAAQNVVRASQSPAFDSIDLSSAFVDLMKSSLDFEAGVKVASLERQISNNTFSILG